jgi:hypothetical protein
MRLPAAGAGVVGGVVVDWGGRVSVVTIGLQVACAGAADRSWWAGDLVDRWGSGETRITQACLPGLGTLPTSRR